MKIILDNRKKFKIPHPPPYFPPTLRPTLRHDTAASVVTTNEPTTSRWGTGWTVSYADEEVVNETTFRYIYRYRDE